MNSKIVFFLTSFTLVLTCDINFPEDYLNACAYDPLMLMVPETGFVIASENCGLEIPKDVFENQPFVFYSEAQDLLKYTLIMVDQDADVDEENLYLHWMLTDVPGDSLKYGLGHYVGKTLAGYIGPDPPEYSAYHRYSIFVYEQSFESLLIPEPPEYRSDFNLAEWVQNIIPGAGLCGPVASMEFKSCF